MSSPSYARHRFPPAIIQHAVWLYLRFALSYRDVEDLLAERGIDRCPERAVERRALTVRTAIQLVSFSTSSESGERPSGRAMSSPSSRRP